MVKRFIAIFIVMFAVVGLLGACSGNNETSSKEKENVGSDGDKSGGSLTFGLAAEPTTMDPYMQNGTHGRTVKLAIFRGLYNYNEKGELEAELAESYTSNDDLTAYTFTLRDAKFHNGDPVTAEDIKYTFDRIINPDSKATFKTELSIIDNIVVEGDKTVTFNLKEPSAPFVHFTALPESVIVSKSYTEANIDDIATKPMGAGPFKFASWTQGSKIIVEKFEDYYKEGQPYLDKIEFQFYSEENTRVNALRAGDVDLIETVPWKDAESIGKTDNLKLASANGPFMALQFNTDFEPFSKPEVRKAIAYGIDRNAILNTAFSGRGKPIYGMATLEGYMGYDEKYTKYFEHDVKKAKELLAEAGYPNGFKATLLSTSQYGMHEQTAVAVQSELKKIGIEVELELPDWATRINKNVEGDYQFVVAGTSGDITDGDWMSNFYKGGPARLNNSANFDDEQINSLLEQGRKEIDPAKREEIYKQLIERAMELSPFVYLNWREQSYGMQKNVNGFVNLNGFLSFQSGVTLEETYIEK
ncbi:ABC transporter substrate-binding protein [Bacillus sp. MRMR6]|uniref:ABC transporter substrate-binding protein n=1 Tax=Bacillus sp. MRMR6 TaxID=1928617 RepID=UPI0009521810|nr:ABC transporter substrate-binding protein [Bacillus sp. MRMR6]OLS35417.1 peptide ABC transporter substrate-binding protein [Bacillus sp. MRMR6]